MIYFNEEKKEPAQVNILPMIDVIFAILSFLIISSLYLTKINTIPLELPLSDSTKRLDKKSLIISIDKNSNIFLNQEITNIKKLRFDLKNIIKSENQNIILSADKDISYGEFVKVLDILKDFDNINFALSIKQKD
tara:strand:- start:97 stop:501 length:405 start_codon:yes stop_codon:yes gene_type:complete